MINANAFSGFHIFALRVVRACRQSGIYWCFVTEHLIEVTFTSRILIAIVVDELGDELSYLVNALWDLVIDPAVTG